MADRKSFCDPDFFDPARRVVDRSPRPPAARDAMTPGEQGDEDSRSQLPVVPTHEEQAAAQAAQKKGK